MQWNTMYLALQKLKTGTSTSADMAKLVFRVVLSYDGRCITTADNDCCALLRRLNGCVEQRFRTCCECREFEHTGRASLDESG